MKTEPWTHPLMAGLPQTGPEIEALSHTIINRRLAGRSIDADVLPVVRRVVHASADESFAESLRLDSEAISRGVQAIMQGRPIVCDVHMLQAGITKTGGDVLCAIREPAVLAMAKQRGCTRAAAAMEFLREAIDGGVVAIGNAPTALWKILELAEMHNIRPAVVVGLPVGFVGAAESKQALLESDLCSITNIGPRGGSAVAAAAVNALAILARENLKHDS
jgi:precorrin-8X/cobalt-precorrin-8 methylmutase